MKPCLDLRPSAVAHPYFGRLLNVALEFGLERLRREWEILHVENTPEARRALPAVERILRHLEEGFRLAVAQD